MKFIPQYKTNFKRLEIAFVTKVLKSGWVQTGPITKLFSKKIVEICQASHIQLTNSATSGLFLVLDSLGVGPGDEVITSPYTFVATASAILQTGATVVFADPEDGYNLGSNEIIKKVTTKTKAIICVDFAGVPCNYGCIQKELEANVVGDRPILIADASHSFGSSREGIASGSLADFTIFSFHTVKNITTIDGGAILANKNRSNIDINWDKIFETIRRKSLHGLNHDAYERNAGNFWEYDVLDMGYKYNMTDFSASIGLAQITNYESRKLRRQKILSWYKKELKNQKKVKIWEALFSAEIFPHIFPIQIQFPKEKSKEKLINYMKNSGIRCNVHYKPIPLMTYYRELGYTMEKLANAQRLYDGEVTLPLYEQLTKTQVTQIVRVLNQALS